MPSRRPSTLAIVRTTMLLAGLLALLVGTVRGQERPAVVVLPVSGVIDQIVANYIREGIDRAVAEGAPAVVIQLDTPGGSLDATQDIVAAELSAAVPVMVWVGPPGARAASAGTFLTLAAHVAAMAPASNIGAATPITGEGQDISGDLGKKVLNDTIADITSIAEERGRPVDWAVSTVEDALSFTVDEALLAGAIDFKARTIEDLLQQADGMTVSILGEDLVLEVAGAPISELAMNPFQAFLHTLSDPNIAFILLTLGFYGVFFELQNPNYVTGILGAFALILAFLGLGSLPHQRGRRATDRAGGRPVRARVNRDERRLADDRWPRGVRVGGVCPLHRARRPRGTVRAGRLPHHRGDDVHHGALRHRRALRRLEEQESQADEHRRRRAGQAPTR